MVLKTVHLVHVLVFKLSIVFVYHKTSTLSAPELHQRRRVANGKYAHTLVRWPITYGINPAVLLKSRLAVRVRPGVPNEIHPELHQIGVEQFLEMLRFDQRSKLEELPSIRKWGRDSFFTNISFMFGTISCLSKPRFPNEMSTLEGNTFYNPIDSLVWFRFC